MDPSQLVLELGEVFAGFSPSWQEKIYFGEVAFYIGMTGYVESLCLAEISSPKNLSSLADFYVL